MNFIKIRAVIELFFYCKSQKLFYYIDIIEEETNSVGRLFFIKVDYFFLNSCKYVFHFLLVMIKFFIKFFLQNK